MVFQIVNVVGSGSSSPSFYTISFYKLLLKFKPFEGFKPFLYLDILVLRVVWGLSYLYLFVFSWV